MLEKRVKKMFQRRKNIRNTQRKRNKGGFLAFTRAMMEFLMWIRWMELRDLMLTVR
ncbi:unnamed protein product [Brassica oleracea]